MPLVACSAASDRASFIAISFDASAAEGEAGAAAGDADGAAGTSTGAGSGAAMFGAGASRLAIATISPVCDSLFAGRRIAMKTSTAAAAASAGTATTTRLLRYHGTSDIAFAMRALSSARAMSASSNWQ
ncbi:MAG TPA: hypothetical protein VGI29_12915 [Candidatus Binataceae bacterium]